MERKGVRHMWKDRINKARQDIGDLNRAQASDRKVLKSLDPEKDKEKVYELRQRIMERRLGKWGLRRLNTLLRNQSLKRR